MKKFDRNRRNLLQATGAGLALAIAPAAAGAAPANEEVGEKGQRIGSWTFRQVGSDTWHPATVPGTVHTDLLANRVIEDPFYRTNERDQQWIDKEDWEYRTQIELDPSSLSHEHIDLVFAGLDTYAQVYINEILVLRADNMFREWSADIKPHVRLGANSLRVYFSSPIKAGLDRLAALGFNPPATNDQSENGGLGDKKVSVFTRKAGYHYGWDWGPRFVTSGIWRPVTLRAWSTARICDVQIVQDSLTSEKAELTAVVEVQANAAGKARIDVASPTDPRVKISTEVMLAAGVSAVKIPISISAPRLWWSNGLGEAFLYDLTVRLTASGVDDVREATIGLRNLKVRQEPDADGQSFYIELNGVPVFMKGANYIPNDSFLPRVTAEVHERVVHSAVATNMNMLRVWGGGIYEDDHFYDLCDRNGILVWQDFMFACSMYPGDSAFLDNVREEAVQNVRRLRNHACIALWVGNNEIDSAWQNDVPNGGWGWKQNYTEAQRNQLWSAYQAIFLDILPSTVAALDSQRFYLSSSPIAADNRHASLDSPEQSGDLHYWDVWWGQKPFSEYRTHIGRFMSEYGFQSFPEFATVAAYTEPADRDIFSDVMKAHQRSSIGNQTIKTYMERDYKVPSDFKAFLYVGQVLQAEGIKVAMEAHRARMPYCMGSLFWQINDCWPVASWSSIDYFGRWKAQQYFARKAYSPVLVSPVLENGKVTVTLVSDLLKPRPVTLVIGVMDFQGQSVRREARSFEMPANTASIVFTDEVSALLDGHPPETVLLTASVSSGADVLSENILYFSAVKDLALPESKVEHRIAATGDGFAIGLTSTVLTKNVYLTSADSDGVFEDNYFDLLPGRTQLVGYKQRRAVDRAALAAGLKVMHMGQV